MTAAAGTYRNPPPDPDRDLWWAALRIAAPDTGNLTARHQRGAIRLPYPIAFHDAGELVAAWVCCDPACGGVELNQGLLETNHACCVPARCCADCGAAWRPLRRHMADYGTVRATGFHHGPFTAFWEPGGGAR